jgi:hypothetical protein
VSRDDVQVHVVVVIIVVVLVVVDIACKTQWSQYFISKEVKLATLTNHISNGA